MLVLARRPHECLERVAAATRHDGRLDESVPTAADNVSGLRIVF